MIYLLECSLREQGPTSCTSSFKEQHDYEVLSAFKIVALFDASLPNVISLMSLLGNLVLLSLASSGGASSGSDNR